MTLVALVVLSLLAAVVNLLVPTSWAELRQGREAQRAVVVESAARSGLVELMQTTWVDSTLLGPGPVLLDVRHPTGGVETRVRAERVAGSTWLLASESRELDQAGRTIARAERGILVRVGVYPPDTVLTATPISRPLAVGVE